MLLHQFLIAHGFFHGIEVTALEVFNERHFHGGCFVQIPDNHRQFGEPGHPGRPPPAFSRDNLILPVRHGPYQQGLEYPMFPNGIRQFRQGCFIKIMTGLSTIGFNLPDLQSGRGDLIGFILYKKCFQTFSKAAFACCQL